MKKVWIIIGIVAASIVGIVLLVWLWTISVKNGLIAQDENVQTQWSQIDTQLQRRADLIPNLVATVQGYAKHESAVFGEVANARSALLAAKTPESKAAASAQVTESLGRLLAIAENYPQLKADQQFARLMDELAGTENRIAVARKRYNDSVKSFNQSIRQFPGSLFAPGMGLSKREYFNSPAGHAAVEKAPEVKF